VNLPMMPIKPVRPLGPDFRRKVRDNLRFSAASRGLDGVLLLSPANVFYACGFNFSVNERPIGLYVPVAGEVRLFIPLLELENAEPIEGVTLGIYTEFREPFIQCHGWSRKRRRVGSLSMSWTPGSWLRWAP